MAAHRLNGMTLRSHLPVTVSGVNAVARVLNEHYSLREYVSRRAMLLGNRFKNIGIDPFEIARSDAAEVFDFDLQELSVQEIERRELRKGIEPLLPLPTTANTGTIDNFQSYPPVEWTPGDDTLTRTTIISTGNPSFTPVNSTSSLAAVPGPAKTSPRSFAPSVQLSKSSTAQQQAQPTVQTMHGSTDQANTAMAFNGLQQTTQGQVPNMSSSPFQDNSLSSSFAIDPRLTAATSPASMIKSDSDMQLDYSNVPPTDPELVAKVISALGSEEAKQATGFAFSSQNPANVAIAATEDDAETVDGEENIEDEESETNDANATHAEDVPTAMNTTSDSTVSKVPTKLFAHPGVSSLGTRGMHLPVKTQGGRKRSPDVSDDQSEGTSGDESLQDESEVMMPPPSKKSKVVVKGPQQPQRETAVSTSAKAGTRKAPARNSTTKDFENIVTGNALPRTPQEAQDAADTRVTRLIAFHNAERKAHKRRQIKPDNEPDFMPEHFYVSNFVKGQEEDSVRCVCGTIIDDGRNMIACDGCGVWQHHRCMGDAVPKDLENGRYHCHVCDPWVHSELIAKLRREHPL